MSLLDNRYEGMKFVNYDSVADEKRGCFSLVFRAHDRVEQKIVALKFYDIDPHRMMDVYRQNAFEREHIILQTLQGKKRCLQLASALSTFHLGLPLPDGTTVTIPCRYFAVEWIDNDIDAFFLGHGTFTPVQKLQLFNEVVLAVESLHRMEVFHRDVKTDNFRAHQNAIERIVVAIDLGTAARISSGYLNNNYAASVGAPWYAASEARCGLAGHRYLAPFTDKYALGCLLFELFNQDYFYRELTRCNRHYDFVLSGMAAFLHGANNEKDQLVNWKKAVAKLGAGITPITIDGSGSSVPPGIANLLNELLAGLTHINYSNRPSLEWSRKRIWSAIKVLENAEIYQRHFVSAKSRRIKRQEKIEQAQARLIRHLGGA